MQSTARSAWRVGRVAGFVFLSAATAALAADVLFPEPLHLVRRVEDSLSGEAIELDEYCSGERIITVRGARTAIADYGVAQQLIEIDRDANSYSVTPFSELAPAAQNSKLQAGTQSRRDEASVEGIGSKPSRSGRTADWYAIRAAADHSAATIEIAVDREITMTRRALEALTGVLGSALPARNDATARACRRAPLQAARGEEDRYGLPLEQVMTFDDDDDDERATLRSSVVHIDHDAVPPELVAIPAGARLVPSRRAQVAKSLQELDSGLVPPLRP